MESLHAKAKQHNYSQDDLYDHISKGVRDNILTIVERDETGDFSEIDFELTQFVQFYTTVLFDYESYFGDMESVPEKPNVNLRDIDPTLEPKIDRFYTAVVTWSEFISMWYRDLDKRRVDPLYLLHRKRFYDWFGNKALQATIEMVANKPLERWRYVLKKMCKMGVIDHEYIKDTCDMGCVTEKYLMIETNRYI